MTILEVKQLALRIVAALRRDGSLRVALRAVVPSPRLVALIRIESGSVSVIGAVGELAGVIASAVAGDDPGEAVLTFSQDVLEYGTTPIVAVAHDVALTKATVATIASEKILNITVGDENGSSDPAGGVSLVIF